MVKSFNSFANLDDLLENTLYTTPAERDVLLKDKARVAAIFVTNFFGTLGLINALKPAQKKTVINFLRKDKRVQVANISDDNHDISLSLKLAHEAGFFVSNVTSMEISKFLFKLKSGQIDTIDSAVAAGWANGLKPDFALSLKDPYIRSAFIDFRDNGGKTVDISRLAVVFKRRINKLPDGGDFKRFAKRFFGLTEVIIGQTAAAATTITPAAVTVAPAKLNNYQRQKLKKLQAAAAAAAAQPTPADDAALKAQVDAENEAGKAVDESKITGAQFNKMLDVMLATPAFGVMAKKSDQVTNMAKAVVKPSSPYFTNYRALALDLINEIQDPLVDNYIRHNSWFTILGDDILEMKKTLLDIKKKYIKITADIPGSNSFEDYLNGAISQLKLDRTLQRKYILRLLLGQMLLGYEVNQQEYKALVQDSTSLVLNALAELVSKISRSQTEMFKDLYNKILSDAGPGFIRGTIISLFRYHRAMAAQSNIVGVFGDEESATIALDYLRNNNKDFKFAIDSVSDSFTSSANISALMARFLVDGYDTFDKYYGIERDNIPYLKSIVIDYFNSIKSTYNTENNKTIKELIVLLADRQFQLSNINGPLPTFIQKEIIDDLKTKSLTDSNLSAIYNLGTDSFQFPRVARMLGLDMKDLLKREPNNEKLIRACIEADGPENYTIEQIAAALSVRTMAVLNVTAEASALINKVGMDKADKIVYALATLYEKDPQKYNRTDNGQRLLQMLPEVSSDTVVKMMTVARDNNMSMVMGPKLYDSLQRVAKQMYVDCLTGVIQDTVGSPVEDYVSNIVEELPNHVIQKMRANLVGAQVLIDEINTGLIQPFDKIDNAKLKKIFQYNDIDMSQLVSGAVERKKKNESYGEYFKRAVVAIKTKKLLEKEKVTLDDAADKKQINRIMISRDHAGKHGDIYPKILKVYNAKLEHPEFEQFRKNNFGDGTVVPAYHGTGGIAAGMILRYGFKVSKQSDGHTTGRMLGDGIYFTNKIDKSMQYMSNAGYARTHGMKGYVMELEVTLGKSPRDYRAGGLGNDNLRSPEWCVYNPKAQIRVVKVYEIELNPKKAIDQYLKEDYNGNIRSFKQHLKEQLLAPTSSNQMGFIFRDGMIPIITPDYEGEFTAVDFEEALKNNLITEDMFEVTGQGPMIVFRNTREQKIVDLRYNWQLSGRDLEDYVLLFQEKMRPL